MNYEGHKFGETKTIGDYKAKQCGVCKAVCEEGDDWFNMVCIPATKEAREEVFKAFKA